MMCNLVHGNNVCAKGRRTIVFAPIETPVFLLIFWSIINFRFVTITLS